MRHPVSPTTTIVLGSAGRGSSAANGLMLVPLITPEIVMAVSLLLVFTQLSLIPFSLVHLGTGAQVVG